LTLACIAAADTGAYFAGRAFGRHKLSPALSPKKTVEGALGGALASMGISAALAPALTGLTPASALILGAALAGCSILGDLLISALKRYAGAKDTSRLLPGHGGVMDRFDSLVFAGPVAWLGLKLLGA
jgi:phosphatidate cytidylyltransferase